MTGHEERARAIAAGALALLPTDTVYGLVCTAFDPEAARHLYLLKGREEIQPTALVFASVDAVLTHIPELRGRSEAIARVILPGPFTIVVPNPARRFSWLAGGTPGRIGVRVPVLAGQAAAIVERLDAVVATSANLPGGADPLRLADVPTQIRTGVAFAVDGGDLPGVPSTVIDVTATEPLILRVGAGDPEAALALIAATLTQSLPARDRPLTPGD